MSNQYRRNAQVCGEMKVIKEWRTYSNSANVC
jgi:hypothetical protein